MEMFKKWFKPKWQHRDPAIRKIAVERLDAHNDEDKAVIEQLARQDPDQQVRRAAVAKVRNLALLVTLLKHAYGSSENDLIRQRIAELISADNNDIDVTEKQRTLEQLKDHDLYRYVLQNCQQPEILLTAVAAVDDDDQLERFAIEGRVAKVRRAAAEKLTQAEALSRVAAASKGKDKNVYRISKDKLDVLREQQQREKQEQAECERLCEQIETLSRTPVEPLYEQKLKHLTKQWQELTSQHKPAFQGRFDTARDNAERALKAYQEEETRRREEGERTQSAEQELRESVRVIEEAIQLVQETAHVADVDLPAIQGLVTTQQNRWEEAASVVTPDNTLKGRYQKLSKDLRDFLKAARAFMDNRDAMNGLLEKANQLDRQDMGALQQTRRRLQKLNKQVEWPTLFRVPDELQRVSSQIEHLHKLEQQLFEQSKQNRHNIDNELTKLEGEIEAGRVKAAHRKLKELQNLIKRLPNREADEYQYALKRLTSQLNELKDWQGFVTTPKKEQLCEQMEALIDSNRQPQELADEIKVLQDEWRRLGRAEPGREQELWQRFREAGDRAFEPCKAYFDELSEQRRANVEKRQQLCDQLTTYIEQTDWDHVRDWANVLEAIKVAKREWRDYSPVERKANKPVQQRFDALLNDLQGRLDAERERNADKRRALIEEVKALADHEDVDYAVGEAKRVQQEWKQIGLVQRKVDNQLWKEFRATCDVIFDRRQQKLDDQRAAREGNQGKAEAVCQDMEAFLKESHDTLLEQKAKVHDFKQRFDDCHPLPRKGADQLRDRYQQLHKQIREKLDQAQRAREQARYELLWEKAAICRQLEQAILNNGLDDEQLAEFKERWAACGELPDAATVPMNTRFDVAVDAFGAGDTATLKQQLDRNQEKLNELVIRMEIAAGVDSPESDRQKRMELQVNRLSESLGGGGPDQSEHHELLIQWCATGPVPADAYDRLEARFKHAYYGEQEDQRKTVQA